MVSEAYGEDDFSRLGGDEDGYEEEEDENSKQSVRTSVPKSKAVQSTISFVRNSDLSRLCSTSCLISLSPTHHQTPHFRLFVCLVSVEEAGLDISCSIRKQLVLFGVTRTILYKPLTCNLGGKIVDTLIHPRHQWVFYVGFPLLDKLLHL